MKDSYESRWAEYRSIRKRGIYALLAFVVLPFLIIPAIGLLTGIIATSITNVFVNVLFLIEVGLLFTAGYYAYLQYTWDCPRCGERFGRLHDECQNCGLSKWAGESETQLSESAKDSGRSGPRI
jgi:hypothetical protein